MTSLRVTLSVLSDATPKWVSKAILQAFCDQHNIRYASKTTIGDLIGLIRQGVDQSVRKTKNISDSTPLDPTEVDAYVLEFGTAFDKAYSETDSGAAGEGSSTGAMPANTSQPDVTVLVNQVTVLATAFTRMMETFQQVMAGAQANQNMPSGGQGTGQSSTGGRQSLTLPGLKISLFTGDVERADPFEWLDTFQSYATVSRWTLAQTTESVRVYLTGDALAKWGELTVEDKATWERAKAVWLEKLLGEKRAVFRVQLAALKQGNKTVSAYHTDFMRLARFACFTAREQSVKEDDWQMCEKFVAGLKSSIQKDVRRECPMTLSTARCLAEKSESLSTLCGETVMRQSGDSTVTMVRERGRQPLICHKCGGEGHKKAQCPSSDDKDDAQSLSSGKGSSYRQGNRRGRKQTPRGARGARGYAVGSNEDDSDGGLQIFGDSEQTS